MTAFHLDYESFSKADITVVGAARYASDPTTEILMFAIATDTEGPYLWVNPKYGKSHPKAMPMLRRAFNDPDSLIWAHSCLFELFISMYRSVADLGMSAPLVRQWRCTSALARRAAMPDSLEQCALTLGLTQQKDPKGKALIRKFSCPDSKGKRTLPTDDPIGFAEFGEYCLQDVRTEQAIHRKLKPLELTGALLDTFIWDLEMNAKGIPVNVPALRQAKLVLDEEFTEIEEKFYMLTELMPTQREKVKALLLINDCPMEDMTADTVEETLARLDPKSNAYAILELYSTVQYAAARKVYTMLDCVCADGYVRGVHLFYGAGTGRWSGRLIQPQNFKKPTVQNASYAYVMLCAGHGREEIELIFPSALEAIASCIRNFIQPHTGDFLDADYAAVEARIVCWLAGQEDVLDMFREGRDLYKIMAGLIYKRHEDQIVNPSEERELGKRTILGCGFQMGPDKFKSTCEDQYGIMISKDLAVTSVGMYRSLCWKVADLWADCDTAARSAIMQPGKVFKAGAHLSFQCRTLEGIPYLCMKLPSGRNIVYPWPKIENVERQGQMRSNITFHGNIKGKLWGRVSTYGGKLVENATQGTAADLMANGAKQAAGEGFDIRLLVHDQALALRAKGQTIEKFLAALTRLPPWAAGLPLKAEGKVVPYYLKG